MKKFFSLAMFLLSSFTACSFAGAQDFNWEQIGGDELHGSWSDVHTGLHSMQVWNDKLYAGTRGDNPESGVWSWDGSTWTQIGGDEINGSWPASFSRGVVVLTTFNDNLTALVRSRVENEIWDFNGTEWSLLLQDEDFPEGDYIVTMSRFTLDEHLCVVTSDGIWLYDGLSTQKIADWDTFEMEGCGGGDLIVFNNRLIFSTQGSCYEDGAGIWSWDGDAWTKIGGGGVNGSWESVEHTLGPPTMGVYEGRLVVGHWTSLRSGLSASVWSWDGSTWTQIGGDGLNGSWGSDPGTTQAINSLLQFEDKLVAAVQTFGIVLRIWSWDGSTWTQIGGDEINCLWPNETAPEDSMVSSMTNYDAKLHVAVLNFDFDGSSQLWRYVEGACCLEPPRNSDNETLLLSKWPLNTYGAEGVCFRWLMLSGWRVLRNYDLPFDFPSADIACNGGWWDCQVPGEAAVGAGSLLQFYKLSDPDPCE